jgi:hypothetical protein
MEECNMKAVNVAEPLSAMQRIFLPTSELSETMRMNACSFWEHQKRILDAMQTFTHGWYERRHTGTDAAFEAAQRMCKAETPIDVVREYQEWASGALQRVMADGLACQQQFMAVAGALERPSAASNEKEPESPQAEAGRIRSKAA